MSEFFDMLKRELRLGDRDLTALISSAPLRYKVYNIPKRTGGYREIAHPAPELKIAQRVIVSKLLVNLPVHPCATAYRKGSSIRLNAERHVHNRPILKYDFCDFFPSITEQSWLVYCSENGLLDREDAIRAARLLFRRAKGSTILRLSIGAPSSPMLSNVMMNDFDREVHERVSSHKITFTRYADDLTFSAEKTWNLREVDGILASVLANMRSPRLRINEKKTAFITPKFARKVTGLVLTNDQRISIGRDRKRLIRASINYYQRGILSDAQVARLSGMLAFVKDVEPEFFTRMELAYGKELIASLKSHAAGYRRPRLVGTT